MNEEKNNDIRQAFITNYYLCYSTNPVLLSEKVKDLKVKSIDLNYHKRTSIASLIMSIVSLSIDRGLTGLEIKIKDPKIGNKVLGKEANIEIKFKPLMVLPDIMVDEDMSFKKITQNLVHDQFNLFTDVDYGQVIKYTCYINLGDKKIYNEKTFNQEIGRLGTRLIDYMLKNDINYEEKFQLPLGNTVFNIKMNTSIKKY